MEKIKLRFGKGYIFLKKGKGPVYVVLHSGPRFGNTIDRDIGADSAASLCWQQTGGTLIMATIPRQQEIGIDFNRDAVSKEKAIKSWGEVHGTGAGNYKNVYAWSAADEKDYSVKKRVYEDFWEKVKSSGSIFILVHSMGMRVGHIPSMVDIITFDGKGISEKRARAIVSRISKKHSVFFSRIRKNYNKSVLIKHDNMFSRMFEKNHTYIYNELIERDMDKVKKYAEPGLVKRYLKSPKKSTYLAAVKSALERGGVHRLTMENVFSGKKAFGPKKYLLEKGKKAVEIEFNEFLVVNFPEKASDILKDITDMVAKSP